MRIEVRIRYLLSLICLSFCIGACGFGAVGDEQKCEPDDNSRWSHNVTSSSGSCPDDWVEWAEEEFVSGEFVYRERDYSCGYNFESEMASPMTANNACEVTAKERATVENGEFHDGSITVSVDCGQGGSCYQEFLVDYLARGSESENASGDENIQADIADRYWAASFSSEWRPSTFAWNQMELDDEIDEILAYLHLRSDETYTYVENYGFLDGTAIYSYQTGTWRAADGRITITDECGREVSHSLSVSGDAMVVGAIEWKNKPSENENNFYALKSRASEECAGHLSPDNPQKR